jgi:hypothetical protein
MKTPEEILAEVAAEQKLDLTQINVSHNFMVTSMRKYAKLYNEELSMSDFDKVCKSKTDSAEIINLTRFRFIFEGEEYLRIKIDGVWQFPIKWRDITEIL